MGHPGRVRGRRRTLVRLGIAAAAAALVAFGTLSGAGAARDPAGELAPDAPNILFILTDDQRADTLDVMPETSKLFVDQGTEFTHGYVTTSLCCPSRSSIMTGRYVHNHGVYCNCNPNGKITPPLPNFDATIQRYLHDAGYQTGIVGKYLNNVRWGEVVPPYFDRYAIFGGGYSDPPFNTSDGPRSFHGRYSTDVVRQLADQDIDAFETNDDRPWFLYVAPQAPHKPWTPDTKYADAPVPPWTGDPAVFETDHSDKPPWTRWGWTFDQVKPTRDAQLRTLMSVDDLVGSIFKKLAEDGETNTLAVFTSDNGYLWGEHGIGLEKRFGYLPSMQVPLLARWPGHIAGGVKDDRLVANIDFLPSFLDAAGLSPQLFDPIDGHSLLGPYARSRLLFEYFKSPDSSLGPWSGDVTESSEYIEWYQPDGTTVKAREYYDLANDPWQLSNLLGDSDRSNDPRLKPLKRLLARDRACSGSTCP